MHEKTKALLEAVKEWRTTSAVLEEGREVQGLLPGGPLGHETYLGNFAHELEAL